MNAGPCWPQVAAAPRPGWAITDGPRGDETTDTAVRIRSTIAFSSDRAFSVSQGKQASHQLKLHRGIWLPTSHLAPCTQIRPAAEESASRPCPQASAQAQAQALHPSLSDFHPSLRPPQAVPASVQSSQSAPPSSSPPPSWHPRHLPQD